MRSSSWRGAPALVCDRPICPRREVLWLTRSRVGRTLLVTWLVLLTLGVIGLLTGCGPDDGLGDPKPIQTGRQDPDPEPRLTVIRPNG